MAPRIVFKDVKKGDVFISTMDKVRVGRRFIVERKTKKPKRVFMWTIDEFVSTCDFTMAEINRGMRRAREGE